MGENNTPPMYITELNGCRGGGSQEGGKNETGGMYLPGLFPLPFSGLHGTDHLLSGREPEKRGSSGIDQRR